MKNSFKRWLPAIKLCVTLGLLALLYANLDFASFRRVLAGMHWAWLPMIYALLFLNTALSAFKWWILLRADGIHVPLHTLTASYLIGTFFNMFLPSSIGGDAYRIYDVSRRSARAAEGFASVFADRLTGFLALAIWGLLFSAIGFSRLPDPKLILLSAVVFLGMITLVALVVQQRLLLALLRMFRMDRVPKLMAFVEKFLRSVSAYHTNGRVLIRIMAISLLFQMLAIFIIFLISRTIGMHVPFVYFCIFVPLITLAEALPISIFGIGVRDFSYVFFLIPVGATREQALSLALVYVLLTITYATSGGLLFLLRRGAPAPTPAAAS